MAVTRVHACVVIALGLAGCGRVDFDGTDDARGGDAASACGVQVDLGALEPFVAAGNGSWLAATATPDGLIVAYTTPAGVSAFAIDLRAATPSRGSAIVALPPIDDNLQVIVSADRVIVSARDLDTVDTDAAIFDLALGAVTTVTVPGLGVGAPYHAAPTADMGGSVLVGIEDPPAIINGKLAHLDRDGAITYPAPIAGTTTLEGGSITQLVDGSYVVGWFSASAPCELQPLDTALNAGGAVMLTPCTRLHVATSSADRVGATWFTAGTTKVATYDATLASTTTAAVLAASEFGPPRIATGLDSFWSVLTADGVSLTATRVDEQGTVGAPIALAPFAGLANGYIYDVIARDASAYAVWASNLDAPELYMMQLCPT